MTGQIINPLQSSAVWQVLRSRLGAREERALVFLAADATDHLLPPHGADHWGYPLPTARAVRKGLFYEIAWVSLTERRFLVDIPRRPPKPPARYEIAWKVTNPVVAARQRVTEERARSIVVDHISKKAALPGAADPLRQPPSHLGTTEVKPPGQPQAIAELGLAYWFLDPPAALLNATGPGAEPNLPSGFGEAHREAYRFYREVVSGGPAGLAALWLLFQPEQAKDVLDWTVEHRDLLSDRGSWERTLASTLKSLTPEDRGFVGVNMAQVLRDVGVPQGDEVLRRITETGGGKARPEGSL